MCVCVCVPVRDNSAYVDVLFVEPQINETNNESKDYHSQHLKIAIVSQNPVNKI